MTVYGRLYGNKTVDEEKAHYKYHLNKIRNWIKKNYPEKINQNKHEIIDNIDHFTDFSDIVIEIMSKKTNIKED